MTDTPAQQAEPRNKSVGVAVTATERECISLVAKARGISESEVIRTMKMGDVVTEGMAVLEAMKKAVA